MQSLNKHGDPLNRDTDIIVKLIDNAKAVLFIDRKDPKSEAASKVALNALQRIAPFHY